MKIGGKDRNMALELVVTIAINVYSLLSTEQSRVLVNKGVARDRNLSHILNKVKGVDPNRESSWAIQCQMLCEELEERKGLSTSVALVSGILSSLKDKKVTRDSMKTTGLKRSIDFVSKRKSRRYCVDGPCVIPGQDSDNDVKAETNFRSEK